MGPFWPNIPAMVDQSNEASQLFEVSWWSDFEDGFYLLRLRLNSIFGCCVAQVFTFRFCPKGFSWIDLKPCGSKFGKNLLKFSEMVSAVAFVCDQEIVETTSNKL